MTLGELAVRSIRWVCAENLPPAHLTNPTYPAHPAPSSTSAVNISNVSKEMRRKANHETLINMANVSILAEALPYRLASWFLVGYLFHSMFSLTKFTSNYRRNYQTQTKKFWTNVIELNT